MPQASRYVTREEFLPVKETVERLSIRVEVLTQDLHRLTNQVADLAEDVAALREEVREGFALMATRAEVQELARRIDDGNAALMSAILSLAR